MKTKIIFACFALAACAVADEAPLAFRKRIETVHQKNVRDAALKPAADEFAFADGVALEYDGGDALAKRGLADFADYLAASMNVKTGKGGAGKLSLALDKSLPAKSCRIETSKSGIAVRAADGRAAMQALFHLEDVMNLRRAPFVKFGTETRRPKYSRRMTHSGWGVDMFPDGYLGAIAHAGFDAILFYVDAPDRTRAGKVDVNDLIARAAAWGLDSYLYASLSARRHPDDPGFAEAIDATYGAVAKKHRGAKGFVMVPESSYFDSHDERVSLKGEKWPDGRAKFNPSRFPCNDYPRWLKYIETTMRKEIPDLDFIFWTYNFFWTPEVDRFKFIDSVTPTTTLNVTFALAGDNHPTRLGMKVPVDDYSIGYAGPSTIFRREAAHAHERGLRVYTMCNTGGRTWDFGCCPYEPVPQQWKRRYDALAAAQGEYGLSGLMESHHYGFVPNFVAELSKEAFTEGGMDFARHLRAIAARDFGEAHADETVAVWDDLSEAIQDYVATSENQYGPFRVGPAYPFNALGPYFKFGDWPDFRGWICNPNYSWRIAWDGKPPSRRPLNPRRVKEEIALFNSAGARFVAGGAKLRAFADELAGERKANARREAGVAEYIGRAFITCANVKAAALEEAKILDAKSSAETKAAAKAEIERLAKIEYANTLAAIPLVKEDSLLGWESSMKYGGGIERLEWKLRHMEELYGADAVK